MQPDPRPRARKPYVTPRVVQVQRRDPGDNLAQGCKMDSGPANITRLCLDGGCQFSGSS